MLQERTSPAKIVAKKKYIPPSEGYTKASIKGRIKVFASTGGIDARYGFFESFDVKKAPIKVARLPKIISGKAAPVTMFEIRHPKKRPGIADGKKAGRTHNASENRIPLERPNNNAEIYVRTT